MKGETVWLSLNQMADLFQRDKSVISRHVRNVFEERELERGATVADFATVQMEGDRDILTHGGTVSHQAALDKAQAEYEQYRKQMLEEASRVEEHFIDAVQEIKQLEKKRNTRSGRKARKGK